MFNIKKYVKDLSIYKDVIFQSKEHVFIEEGAKIGPGTIIAPNVIINTNTIIGKNVMIYSSTVIKDSIVGDNCVIGQFVLIRDNTNLKGTNTIGPFSEIARSIFEFKASAFHMAKIFDTHLYENVMLGNGVTTANTMHDNKKRQTIIEKNAKIGVNVSLIAPVTIGHDSFIGAGSTITKDVLPGKLVIARGKQIEIGSK